MLVGKFNIFRNSGTKEKKLDKVTLLATETSKMVITDTKKIIIVKKGV